VPNLAVYAGVISALATTCSGDPDDLVFSSYDGARPGASVAVIKDGAIVFERSYGLANVERGERTSGLTNYRLASITKQFTATAILLLAERGALAIDDPVARHLPELAKVAPAVTLRQLLTHTSGLPDYEKLLGDDETRQIVDRDVLALVAKAKVQPAGTYHYSNTGYALLALVIERVSKLSYSEFLSRNIFTPLHMTASGAYDATAAIPERAYGYSERDGTIANSDQSPTSRVLGDGGVYSSTHDLAKWIDALDHRTLAPKLYGDAISAQVATDVAGVGYGFGWKIGDQRGEKLVFHTGTTSGFKNALVWVPSKKLAVVVLTNRRQGEPLTLARLVLDQFWD
jgi:CubicO group peptidase (beta-lactamase class C family)